MFRIRSIQDAVSPANRDAIAHVQQIIGQQFPRARPDYIEKLPAQLQDPTRFRYRTILLVAENRSGRVFGFAMLLHMTDLRFTFLELISAAAGTTGRGIGGALYERAREESLARDVDGLFFECSVDDGAVVSDAALLRQNVQRLAFYERLGVRPLVNNDYASPVFPGDEDLYYLMYDGLGHKPMPTRARVRKVVSAILDRKYHDIMSVEAIDTVANSFVDDPVQYRAYRYARNKPDAATPVSIQGEAIALFVNASHNIHHVRDRGYVEAPVRIDSIMEELNKTSLFEKREPERTPDSLLRRVHARDYLDYLKEACEQLPAGRSIYPIIFPVRNQMRPPKDIELALGYYCTDTFTPLHKNVYLAARGAVDCAYSGALALLEGRDFAYALVRPPGHHAERRVYGGFCYLNSAAVAAEFLSAYGRVAVLDVDFHHGNGTQDIFYTRADVLTVSIHGAPPATYPHFGGFADERGSGVGEGFNINYPLPDNITPADYHRTLARALQKIRAFKPAHLVISLGLDTARADPTGTWSLVASDFVTNGRMIGELGLPTLIVQEGGYRTRTLGINARSFFEGLVSPRVQAASPAARTPAT